MKRKLLHALIILSSVTFQFCNIHEPTAPRWDTSANIPIAKKEYTLMELIEKNPDLFKNYTSGPNTGLIYYATTKEISDILIEDKLKVDGFSENVNQEIGPVKIENVEVNTEVGIDWIGVQVPPNTQTKIPPVNNAPISAEFSSSDKFESMELEKGNLNLVFTNHFNQQVSLTVSNITLQNLNTGENIINIQNPIEIPPAQTVTLNMINLNQGTTIRNPLKFSANVSTNGSNDQFVTIPEKSISINAELQNVEVKKAKAKIPPQDPIVIESNLEIDKNESKPTKIDFAKLKNGTLNLRINNQMDVDAQMSFEFPNLKNPSGQMFSVTRAIPKKQTTTIFNNFSLAGYSLTKVSANPTNKLDYKVTFEVIESNDFRTIQSTDGISAEVGVDNIELSEFTGILKPIELNPTRTSVSLNADELKDKLNFKKLNIRNPKLELHLRPTSNIEFSIDGKIQARNSNGSTISMSLNQNTLVNKFNVNSNIISNTDTILIIKPDSLSKFLGRFSSFPDSIIVIAQGTVNPAYKTVSVKNTDIVAGNSKFEFPLDLALQDGEFTDSISIDLKGSDKDELDKSKEISLILGITNGIPAEIKFTGKIYDEFDNFLMYFPPKYDNQDTVITLNAAMTNSSGDVIENSEQVISVRAGKSNASSESDIQKLKQAKYMRIKLRLNTSGNGSLPAKFKTSDMIKIHASGSTTYSVQP